MKYYFCIILLLTALVTLHPTYSVPLDLQRGSSQPPFGQDKELVESVLHLISSLVSGFVSNNPAPLGETNEIDILEESVDIELTNQMRSLNQDLGLESLDAIEVQNYQIQENQGPPRKQTIDRKLAQEFLNAILKQDMKEGAEEGAVRNLAALEVKSTTISNKLEGSASNQQPNRMRSGTNLTAPKSNLTKEDLLKFRDYVAIRDSPYGSLLKLFFTDIERTRFEILCSNPDLVNFVRQMLGGPTAEDFDQFEIYVDIFIKQPDEVLNRTFSAEQQKQLGDIAARYPEYTDKLTEKGLAGMP